MFRKLFVIVLGLALLGGFTVAEASQLTLALAPMDSLISIKLTPLPLG